MKKLSLLALPLMLAACTNTATPQIGMTPSINGADITVDVTVTYDDSGTPTSISSLTTTTQPSVNFNVAPSSLGMTLTGYEVKVVDSAGTQFAGTEGQYARAFSARVAGGYACKNGTAVDYATDQCDFANKVPYARTVQVGQIPLLVDAISEEARDMYVSAFPDEMCPTLRMNVTFTGYDDLNRVITPITVTNAPIQVTCNTK
ncbi:hypothetical protein [Deinococcus soli (ex Cha et al. 2016)]|uniref:Uncharacterized protein n=2 Tax=Deinococcus soli (ex Cha et al. 2016) TaxID=1309411 RepID=A0ACC6KAT1_9DEIO|nr:hypothetical protein [Deinococcus soli (ex Cha et al. 2016)]MDR6216469.1 hypothetical protein [Deinococcus soli (ex Cha et al. 2016)]MDR6327290.1 hypothetical protein [Deinococcus soli (ex Cha et al. 2016)]MDR6749565.1 hypothetical protein [Deinococcus soli (ex Cha et al. 2016)]